MHIARRLPMGLVATSAGLLITACGGTTATTTTGAAASQSSAALIHTQSMKVGSATMTVLKNAKGLTLYYFTADAPGSVACTGGCTKLWPPLLSTTSTPSGSGNLPGQLTVVNDANGNQVAYNGHPLYTFSKDGDSGDAYGQGIAGKWFVATPDLAAVSAGASASYSSY